jgi:2,4-dichlorophenol 6-monooxygenase
MTQEEADARLDDLYGPDGESERAALFGALELMDGQFNAHGVELGQQYESGAIVAEPEPGAPAPRDPELSYEPSTRPGSPLPHAWLNIGNVEASTFDVCAYDRYTLITGAGGSAWLAAAEAVSAETGVEISGVRISLGLEVNDVLGQWTQRREVGDSGCVLVRPDRIVAWRSDGMAEDPSASLRSVMAWVLGVASVKVSQ